MANIIRKEKVASLSKKLSGLGLEEARVRVLMLRLAEEKKALEAEKANSSKAISRERQ